MVDMVVHDVNEEIFETAHIKDFWLCTFRDNKLFCAYPINDKRHLIAHSRNVSKGLTVS